MKIRKLHVLLLVTALAVPLAVVAAFGRQGPEGHHHKRARLFLVLRMADTLGLSDQKALEVNDILKQAEAKRDELIKKRHALNDEIRDALAKPKPDDTKLSTLIDQAVALDRERMQAFEDSFNSLKKVLTVEQQAKLVLLRARMHGEAHPGMGGPHGGMGRWHRGGWGHHDEGPASAANPKEGPGGPDAEE